MSSTKQDAPANPSLRIFRLRWLSWFVLLLMSAAIVIIIVPGNFGYSVEYELYTAVFGGFIPGPAPPPVYRYMEVQIWSHGWPFEYLRRPYSAEANSCLIDFGYPVEWSTADAWRFAGKKYAFNAINLLVDLVIGIVLVALAVVPVELWRRRRGRFRFSLFDAIVFVAVVCGILTWWQIHSRAKSREQAIKAAMKARGSLIDNRAGVASNYCGPDWLLRLVGNPYLIPFCQHIDKLDLDTTLLSPADYAAIRELRFVESVHLTGKLNEGLADALAALPALRTLDGLVTSYGGFPNAPKLEPLITGKDLSLLRRLPNVRCLNLGSCKVPVAEVEYLAQRPNLESLQICDDDLLVEDIEPIARSQSLKTLDVCISATQQEQKAFNARHPNLVVNWNSGEVYNPDEPENFNLFKAGDCDVLFKRWRREDGLPPTVEDPQKNSFLECDDNQPPYTVENDSHEPITGLNFSQVRLTRQRLDQIPFKEFPYVGDITFGKVDSAETAMELISRCGTPLRSLDVRYVPLTKRDFDKISFADNPELKLQQGPLTADDLRKLGLRLKTTVVIYLFASRFSHEEIERIVFPGPVFIDFYKGFDTDPDE